MSGHPIGEALPERQDLGFEFGGGRPPRRRRVPSGRRLADSVEWVFGPTVHEGRTSATNGPPAWRRQMTVGGSLIESPIRLARPGSARHGQVTAGGSR
jgi:hypothetical protein